MTWWIDGGMKIIPKEILDDKSPTLASLLCDETEVFVKQMAQDFGNFLILRKQSYDYQVVD